jgi:hypothetical protein
MSSLDKSNRVTLRLPNNILESLKIESKKHDLPLNAIITRILSKNIIFDLKFNLLPTITMSQALFSKIMTKLDEKNQREIVLHVPKSVKHLFTILNLNYDLTSIIENHFVIMDKYCGWYTFHHDVNGDNYRLVFESDLGPDWIQFLRLYITSILNSLRISNIYVKIEGSVLVFEFGNK